MYGSVGCTPLWLPLSELSDSPYRQCSGSAINNVVMESKASALGALQKLKLERSATSFGLQNHYLFRTTNVLIL
jgi:hypothetical protein